MSLPFSSGAPRAAVVALVAAAIVTAIACALLLYAGALERRGLLSASRALARRAGLWMALGTLLELPSAAALLVTLHAPARHALLGGDATTTSLAAAAAAASVGAGAIGLLAGLSGKPRPSGGFAASLLVVAVAAAAIAAQRL